MLELSFRRERETETTVRYEEQCDGRAAGGGHPPPAEVLLEPAREPGLPTRYDRGCRGRRRTPTGTRREDRPGQLIGRR